MKRADKIIIAGVGCALADLIYNGVSFNNPAFKKYLSCQTGDGGLSPGKLVFTEELENFSGEKYDDILHQIVGKSKPDVLNVGGPSLVSLILAAQLLSKEDFRVTFYGMAGNDEYGETIFNILRQTPLDIGNYIISPDKATPTTDVFSDPDFDGGHGERTFVNNIGAAWDYYPKHIPDVFFSADITCFGGTALVPQIHDNLTSLLARARTNNCITVVNTVFDFRNQKLNPDKSWPLVARTEDYGLIDVLITDKEEALKISGKNSMNEAAEFFHATDVSSFIITNGAMDLLVGSNGLLFEKSAVKSFPISQQISTMLKDMPEAKGDTTGCGDNFAGGIITSLALQVSKYQKGKFSLSEAISWGVAAGGNCCFTVGGTYTEAFPGELKNKILPIRNQYKYQIENPR